MKEKKRAKKVRKQSALRIPPLYHNFPHSSGVVISEIQEDEAHIEKRDKPPVY